MAKYIVNIPWHGVKKGQIIELEKVHPSLKSNVVPMPEGDDEAEAKANEIILEAEKKAGELTPATPEATADKKATANK